MANYFVECNDSISTSTTIGSWIADATRPRRLALYEIHFGSETSVDAAIQFCVSRITAEGTNTDVVPQPINPADAATESDAGENHTVEPTYTNSALRLFTKSFHQRNGFRVNFAPGKYITFPATASNGFGCLTPTISTGTPASTLGLYVEEQ